ncbi:hypothetical protein [Flammeovirga aprica]|uniref:Uncharacterized protein n=1 Tax=Flammeovirga aprica JL-4 TaxID=694437 RepID=A0A7X9P2S4_9BACT|nr:hypothetical protein [Flammeovirga aprica]NME68498.1 hypothetical protein [Flammeovirga aprica JL-4]
MNCTPLFELWDIEDHTVNESLLNVLGYDKVVPSEDEQKIIIKKYFHFGDDIDNRYYSDPKYGLAAACAGWNTSIVKDFLNHCLTMNDVPLVYVSKYSLKGHYVKLR